jgi:hypothetical protein
VSDTSVGPSVAAVLGGLLIADAARQQDSRGEGGDYKRNGMTHMDSC